MVSVCPGAHLKLICIANQSDILTWTIKGNISVTRSVPISGTAQLEPFSGFGVRLNFKRVSAAKSLPLQSEMLISDGSNPNISGTDIHCSPSNDSDSHITFSIQVLGGWCMHGV